MSDGYRWHTPENLSGTRAIRFASVPLSLLPHVGGALQEMLDSANWHEAGVPVADVIEALYQTMNEWYSNDLIGAVVSFAGTVPPGWVALDGSVLDGNDYAELKAVVPGAWVNGSGDIVLPDMQGVGLVGVGSAPYVLAQTGGSATHTLTVAEMPTHTHTYTPPTLNVDLELAGVPDIQAAGIGLPTDSGSTGAGDPHNNMQPYLALNYAIYTGVV